MKYIDIHCHLNLEQFDLDLNETIARARENEVGMIVVGADFKSSEKAIKIAEENPDIWASIGLHPDDAVKEEFNHNAYLKMAQHPKVVAIGECGLDYFLSEKSAKAGDKKDKDFQKEIFEKHIAIANEVKKPLMLHLRNGLDPKDNAYVDAIEILKKHAKVHGDVHFFAGNVKEAHQFIELGFRLSFTGVITFARNYDEVIKSIPLNMIMSETDAPFVAPIPYRGQRNEPLYVIEIARTIASIKGEDLEKVKQHLIDNAKKLFSI